MSVYDLLDLMIDNGETIEVWDNNSDKIVMSGSIDEVKYEYGDCEVDSFDIRSKDNQAILTINISIE